ncbi:hypothetical protein F8B43_0091 [Methylorubrum populi]|uniref:Uncharacterized protein n=1 Tax=Methylorubrum populi TaxID=223967 RepID=A0A833JCR9_9HYPH|nr:hypothetical protein F8B43_0091 [Methylorubrum populi]
MGEDKWREITDADRPRDRKNRSCPPMLLIGRYPGSKTWSDPYYGWWNAVACDWERWPHTFPPTHCMRVDPPAAQDPALSRDGRGE